MLLYLMLGMLLGFFYCIVSNYIVAPALLMAHRRRAWWWAHHPELSGPAIFAWVLAALLFLGVR